MDIQKRILIFSQRLELYCFLVKRYASAFEVERHEIWYELGDGLITVPEDTALVILDLERDFWVAMEYIRKIRLGGFAGSLLFISRAEKRQRKIEEKISAIDAGADEYLGYPQTREEIAASVRALLRHYGWKEEPEFGIGGEHFFVNPKARKVFMGQKELVLTKTEFSIFYYLLLRLNRSVLAGLLESVGWKITEHQAEHSYPVAEKGEEWLELQPLCLYGAIGKETPKRIGKLLSRAQIFRYCQIEVLSQIAGLPELQKLRKSRERQGDMKTADC